MSPARFSSIALASLLITGMFLPASPRAEQSAPAQPQPPMQQAAPTTPQAAPIAPQGEAQQAGPPARQPLPVQQAAPVEAKAQARP
jgi:hypothetical protein